MTPIQRVSWSRALTIALTCLVLACIGLLIGIGLVARDLNDVATDLEGAADTQQEILDSQVASTEALDCRTEQYKEFFAGVAQAIYALATDAPINDEAIERLRVAANNLPNIDTVCGNGNASS